MPAVNVAGGRVVTFDVRNFKGFAKGSAAASLLWCFFLSVTLRCAALAWPWPRLFADWFRLAPRRFATLKSIPPSRFSTFGKSQRPTHQLQPVQAHSFWVVRFSHRKPTTPQPFIIPLSTPLSANNTAN